MSLPAFTLAVLLLLLTPGPTNTLLAVAGASRGLKASLPLVFAELSGYLATVSLLVFVAAPWLVGQPIAALAVKLASTVWVLLLAARLWTNPRPPPGRARSTFWASSPRRFSIRRE